MSDIERLRQLQGDSALDIRSKVQIVAEYLQQQVASSQGIDCERAGGLAAILRDIDSQLGANIEESERIISTMEDREAGKE